MFTEDKVTKKACKSEAILKINAMLACNKACRKIS